MSLEQHVAEYLYESGGRYTFMNTENYEQIELGPTSSATRSTT